jgi:hypothetical protein
MKAVGLSHVTHVTTPGAVQSDWKFEAVVEFAILTVTPVAFPTLPEVSVAVALKV